MPTETVFISKFNKQIVEAVKKNEIGAFSQLISNAAAFSEKFTDVSDNFNIS